MFKGEEKGKKLLPARADLLNKASGRDMVKARILGAERRSVVE